MSDFFIYNGQDRAWAEWIAWILEEAGYTITIQAWDFRPGQNFAIEMMKAAEADATIAVLSQHYLDAAFTHPEWAAAFVEDPDGEKRTLIPVRIAECKMPRLLKPIIWIDLVGLNEQVAEDALRNGLKDRGKPPTRPDFPGSAVRSMLASRPAFPPRGGRENAKISLHDLPDAGEFLLGRDEELALLDKAWDDPRGPHVITIVARGGEGKSNLVRHWLNRLANDDWRGAERVFGWSFFSQGTRDAVASADQFVDRALPFFGEDHPEEIKSPHDRGVRLGELAGAGRNLLILDGLEPLQYAPGPMEGRLQDPALSTLLASLALQNRGLCVITTRESLPELAGGKSNVSPKIELPSLTPKDGGELLFRVGATKGAQAAREEVSKRLDGHALSIQLLGTYLAEVLAGDIARASEVTLLDQDRASGDHARHILDSYERWLSQSEAGARMLVVLRLLGLFDRPVDLKLFDVLRAKPAIPGLTEPLLDLSSVDWSRTITGLRRLRFLSDESGDAIDAHPLIREHFAKQLTTKFVESAKEAHRRVYEYLKTVAPELPETLEEMTPLLHAVGHGCKAGLAQRALDDVFYPRIERRGASYATNMLGATGATLATLSAFFIVPWREVTPDVTERNAGWCLGAAGYGLRALGRVSEAAEAGELGLATAARLEEWPNAAVSAGNLSQFALVMGHVDTAIRRASEAIDYADRTGGVRAHQARIRFADAFHAAGFRNAGKRAFDDAFSIRSKTQSSFLEGVGEFFWAELILDSLDGRDEALTIIGDIRAALEQRAAVQERPPLSRGLTELALGEALRTEINLNHERVLADGWKRLQSHFDLGVSLMRQASQLSYLPYALLGRAAFWTTVARTDATKALHAAEKDLAETEQIAAQGQMLRWQIEAAVARARLALVRARLASARGRGKFIAESRKKLAEARSLIKSTEKPYVPYRSANPEWKPPEYLDELKDGQIVGYHRANNRIAAIEKELQEFTLSS